MSEFTIPLVHGETPQELAVILDGLARMFDAEPPAIRAAVSVSTDHPKLSEILRIMSGGAPFLRCGPEIETAEEISGVTGSYEYPLPKTSTSTLTDRVAEVICGTQAVVKPGLESRPCRQCKKDFTPERRTDQMFCSTECRNKFYHAPSKRSKATAPVEPPAAPVAPAIPGEPRTPEANDWRTDRGVEMSQTALTQAVRFNKLAVGTRLRSKSGMYAEVAVLRGGKFGLRTIRAPRTLNA